MSDESRQSLEPVYQLARARDYVVETVLVGGVLAAGVALLASGASSWPRFTAMCIGATLLVISISLLVLIRMKAIRSFDVFGPALFEHKITHELIVSDDYKFSRDSAEALRQTLSQRPDVTIKWLGESDYEVKDKLRGYLVECLAVRVIALHLDQYFAKLGMQSRYVREISYEDLKGLTDINPFLAVTAKSPDIQGMPDGGKLEMIVTASQTWRPFRLTLPKGSVVSYIDNGLMINNRYITVKLYAGSSGQSKDIPSHDVHLQGLRRDLIRNVDMINIPYTISIRISPLLAASPFGRRLQGWVDSLIQTLDKYLSFAYAEQDMAWLSAESILSRDANLFGQPWGWKTEDMVIQETMAGMRVKLAYLILELRKESDAETARKNISDYVAELRQLGKTGYANDIDALAKSPNNSISMFDRQLTSKLIDMIVDLERDDQLRAITAEIFEDAKRRSKELQ